ncbi:helix-turn-helix domain-containing protein [Paenibacillus polymyxa]|uniref:helix-turn-helix domain-containing protein n=1 Tax=Paenibacillus polymyxa TaxID=1406 RepID=UPI0009C0BEB3|nr:helix-turn-helix transcriptional regulator [Paenibacillus polymyxa]
MHNNYNSFETYLEDIYYDEMHRAIKNSILQKGRSIDLNSYTVLDPSYIDIENIRVKSITFYGIEHRQIFFNATINAEIVLKGMGKRDYEADRQSKWFILSFYGHLISGLRKVMIIDVRNYSKERFSKENALSKYLVPYLYSEDLDNEAEKFLQKYYPEALENPMPLDMAELLDNMCLTMHYAPLPDNIFGKSYFGEAQVGVFEEDMKHTRTENVDVGTILVNPNVFFMRNIGSENNTIVHECVHHDLHANFFELQKLLNNDVVSISCEVVEEYGKDTIGIDKALHWMEWQANVLTPRILMPLKTTKQKLNEILVRLHNEKQNLRNAENLQLAIEELASFFGVSKLAAKLRAIDVGFEQAAGTFVYVDGRYYPPYSFRSGTLGKNQTFVIDEMNAFNEAKMSQELSEMVFSDKVVYVNAMFCINDPHYVIRYEDGSIELTEYALEHVDECCLIFDRTNRISKLYDDSFYRRCFLCRDVNAVNFVEATYNPNYIDNQTAQERAEETAKISAFSKEVSDELMNMPGSFSKTLGYHIKRRSITNEILAERSGLSSRIISDYRNNESLTKELPTVMALCIGLNLHQFYADDFIAKAGHQWKMTPDHMLYRWLLASHSDENLYQWNKRLEDAGIHQRLPSNKH